MNKKTNMQLMDGDFLTTNDKASYSTRTRNEQTSKSAKERNATEEKAYKFREAMKSKGISYADFNYIVKATGSTTAAENAVIGAPRNILLSMINAEKAKKTSQRPPMVDPAVQSITAGASYPTVDDVDDEVIAESLLVQNIRRQQEEKKNNPSSTYYDGYGEYWEDRLEEEKNEYTWNALPDDYVFEEPHYVEADFNPLDGGTVILGLGGNFVPGAGVSGDVDVYFDSEGKVAIMGSSAADFGYPATALSGRLGFSTANDYKDIIGDFAHIGGSYKKYGAELSGSISNGKIKNLSLVGQYNFINPSLKPFEGHVGYGSTEPLWEGTRDEFYDMIGASGQKEIRKLVLSEIGKIALDELKKTWNEYTDRWSNIGKYPEEWDYGNVTGGFS